MKTNKKDFEVFKGEVFYWVDKFGLRYWQLKIAHRDSKVNTDWSAWCSTQWKNKSAIIGLAINWGDNKVTNYQLCRDAFHEVCELLLSDMVVIGKTDSPPSQIDELSASTHAVIRTLENVFWEPDYVSRVVKELGAKGLESVRENMILPKIKTELNIDDINCTIDVPAPREQEKKNQIKTEEEK